LSDKTELEECIDARVDHINNTFDFKAAPTERTRKESNITRDLEYRLEVVGKGGELLAIEPWHINSFHEIRW